MLRPLGLQSAPMNVIETDLPGVLILEPKLFDDSRGFFMETFNEALFAEHGLKFEFVQDNHSFSKNNVLRGLHFQVPHPQGKLVRAAYGSVFDVAVDVRQGSPRFGKWVGVELSRANRRMLWVPPGFAHGFCVTSDAADVLYKCTDLYDGPSDRVILWNDPALGIDWPVDAPLLSEKDAAAPTLSDAPVLPHWEDEDHDSTSE